MTERYTMTELEFQYSPSEQPTTIPEDFKSTGSQGAQFTTAFHTLGMVSLQLVVAASSRTT